MKTAAIAGSLLASALAVAPARAVLIFGGTQASPTVSRNIVDPQAAPDAYEYVGIYGTPTTGYLGVPIAPQYFITAKHVYSSGTGLSIGGTDYTFHSATLDSGSDLVIVKINETFPTYAPIYTGNDETTLNMNVFGRGRQAGTLVTSPGNNGWLANGTDDRKISWGSDEIDSASNGFLTWSFDPIVGSTTLTDKDSGGPVFVDDGGTWKLAGVNYGISSPWSTSASGSSPFTATIFNASGLYYKINDVWTAVSGPGFSAATRLSDNMEFINSVVPEPSAVGILALGAIAMVSRRRRAAASA